MTESDWLTCTDPQRMLKWVNEGWVEKGAPLPYPGVTMRGLNHKLRLFACACCRQVWHLLTDVRSRQAVEVAERFADGQATCKELDAARAAAWDAAWDAARDAAWTAAGATARAAARDAARAAAGDAARAAAGDAARVAARDAAWTAAGDAARATAGDAAGAAAWTAARATARDAAGDAARKVQVALLRDVAGNPFRPILAISEDCQEYWSHDKHVVFHERWRTATVLTLAHAAYEKRPGRKCGECAGSGLSVHVASSADRCPDCHGTGKIEDGSLDPQRLAVLSDALEEAGCQSEEILRHLRGNEKCPNCWGSLKTMKPKCRICNGRLYISSPHVRGCWALDLLLGKE